MQYKLFVFSFIVFTVSFAFAFNSNRNGKENDYPKTLTAKNFDSYVYNEDTATLVEFYSSYCGYCKRLAPRFKIFAESVEKWKHVVKIAKLNCEDLENLPLCRKHKGSGFPTFRFFGPRHNPNEDGIHVQANDSDKLNTPLMQEMTIKELIGFVTDHEAPKQWPKLKAIIASEKSSLFSGLSISANRPLFIVLDSSEREIGLKVILDLSEHVDKVDVYSAKVNKTLTGIFQENSSLVLIRVKDVKSESYELIKAYEFNETWSSEELAANIEEKRECIYSVILNNYVKHKEMKKEEPLTMVDLYNAIQHSLRHNVVLRENLNVEELNTLKRFLEILLKYFPFQENSHRDDVHELSVWLNVSTEMGISEYNEGMKKYNSLPPERPYIKCKGSSPDLRGYPCSLWSLFHVLTVTEYKKLSAEEGDHEVVIVMRDFIGTFFTCKYCAIHFWNMSEAIFDDEKPSSANSSVLWLWRGHNKVNERLQCDLSEDPKSPKIQFPSHTSCPNCHSEKETWDESSVLEYLVEYYSKENIVNSAFKVTTSKFAIILFVTWLLNNIL